MRDDDSDKQIGVVDDIGRCGVANYFRMSRFISEKADDLRPIFIWVHRNGNLDWGDYDNLVVFEELNF